MTHSERHPDAVEGCFACKVRTVSFGIVPGAYRDTSSTTMYDREAVRDLGLPTQEEVMDRRSRYVHALKDSGAYD